MRIFPILCERSIILTSGAGSLYAHFGGQDEELGHPEGAPVFICVERTQLAGLGTPQDLPVRTGGHGYGEERVDYFAYPAATRINRCVYGWTHHFSQISISCIAVK